MAEGACEGACEGGAWDREGVLGSGFVGGAAVALGHLLDVFQDEDGTPGARGEGRGFSCFCCILAEPDSEKNGVRLAGFCAIGNALQVDIRGWEKRLKPVTVDVDVGAVLLELLVDALVVVDVVLGVLDSCDTVE